MIHRHAITLRRSPFLIAENNFISKELGLHILTLYMDQQ